jgi:hypothetical protein
MQVSSLMAAPPHLAGEKYQSVTVWAAGLMYLRLPLDTTTAGYNRSAALWISMFAFTLMPSETACSVWNQERAVVSVSVSDVDPNVNVRHLHGGSAAPEMLCAAYCACFTIRAT